MNTELISSEAVDLLSRITGQKLSQRDITPPVIFLAALITVLLGVMFVDGTVTDEEKQSWQNTINRFIPPESNVRQLAQLMSKGVRQNQIYTKFDELITLTAPLSESERLLLVSFGYEMSAADSEMDFREKKYLEAVAKLLEINPEHLAVLEVGFSHKGTVEPAALDEVQSLLDPAQFHELDTVFVKAARDMLTALPAKLEHKSTQKPPAVSYARLQRFQQYRQQLETACKQLAQIIQEGINKSLLPNSLAKEIEKASEKLQSQRFRLAVVGEFSKGKSTLLNALLGEEIQPVRDIPCSGTVTVLKHGAQKRVICRYKDGREEEIPFDQYQEKAVISEEAALGNLSDELALSEIDEIIFEHPALALCTSGVEIVDSPGLNEHPNRTAITQKLLKDTDAMIFLTNASQVLTQGERDLLQDLKILLNGGKADVPAENIFVVVNFWDLLRTEIGRRQVQQRVANIVQGQNPIITAENRVHFISTQKALEAILNVTEDEYLKSFQSFTRSIENFLTIERGSLEIKQSATKLKIWIKSSLEGLHQAEEILDGNLKLSEAEKQKILEQIGEASGCDIRIKLLANEIIEQVFEQANESWNEWIEELGERLANKVERWSSSHNPIFDQQKVIQDYVNRFIRDLKNEINNWGDKELKNKILKPSFEVLEAYIKEELNALKDSLFVLDKDINTDFCKQINFEINGIEGRFGDIFTYISGGLFAGGLGAGLLILLGLGGPIMWAVAGIGAAIAGALGFGIGGIHDQIKLKVFETGCKKFVESTEQITEKIGETIASVFDNQVEAAVQVTEQVISLCESLLEQQEKAHKETLEQREAEKAWIAQKRQELKQVQNSIEAILDQCVG
jgi:uncharacterized tellurite resistance protein B-like protein/tRNA U34 5-carboxymethylaminomethyl modifying GTPase MnmE/TrmE